MSLIARASHGYICGPAGDINLPAPTGNLQLVLQDCPPLVMLVTEACPPEDFELLTFNGPASPLEIGDSLINPAFTASYNRTPTIATLDDNVPNAQVDVSATPAAFNAPYTYTLTANNGSVTWTLTAGDGSGPNQQDTHVVAWRPRVYVGTGTPLGVGNGTEAFIEGLAQQSLQSSRAGTYALTVGAGQKAYYAAPTAYGTPTFQIGVFPGGFFSIGVVSVTNAFGVTQDYELFESTNQGLGPVSLQVS